MQLNFTTLMLEKMAEGIISIDRQAAVLGHNRAAEPWVASTKNLAPALRRLIGEEVQGRVLLPVRIDLAARQGEAKVPAADVWMVKNGQRDYAIFIAALGRMPEAQPLLAAPVQASPQVLETHYISLFGDEVRHQLAGLQGQLDSLIQDQGPDPVHHTQELITQAALVSQLLKEISDLTQLMQRDLVFADDRMDPAALIGTLMLELAPAKLVNDITLSFDPEAKQQGLVYGNKPWMEDALRVLLKSLIHGAPKHSRIALGLRQMGDFVVITGRVSNAFTPLHLSLRTSAEQPHQPATGQDAGIAMSMLICQRIIDLHGGKLKLEWLPSAKVESFTLTLVTGAPMHERSHASCRDCRVPMQALSYAEDLASILSQ